MIAVENRVYDIIDRIGSSNVLLQAISGIVGFPATLFVDTGVIFTHYGKMFNEIREVYGRDPIGRETIGDFISGCKNEVLIDIVVDKIIGNIPIIGIPANMIAARAMTWRLGLVMGMLSARGESIDTGNVRKAAVLVRKAFPQQKSLIYQKGNEYEVVGIARHSETTEPMVVYRALYGERGLWIRPASMWNETVERDGMTYRRFEQMDG